MKAKHLNMSVVHSGVGNISANLEHAGEFIYEAARQGAQIALTPDLMPCGYALTEVIWNYAEPFDGPIVAWLPISTEVEMIPM